MKKIKTNFFLRELLRVPMFLVFVAMILIFGFAALGEPAEIDSFAIVTAMGIDFAEDEKFELSLLMFVPMAEESFAENYKMISSTGKSMSEAINLAGLHVGKEVGLSHIKFVVLNEEIVDENISLFLDYLVRSIQLPSSTKVIVTDSSAKDFIEASQTLDSESSIKVSDLITNNGEYIYAIDSSMESFFKGTYGPTRVGLLSVLSLESEESEGIATVLEQSNQASGQGSGQASAQSSGQSGGKSEILNDGDVIICKDGKRVLRVDGQTLKDLNLLRGEYRTGAIEIFDFSDEIFTDADMIFEIFDHSDRFSVDYENGIPVVNVDVSLTVRLSEIVSDTEISRENVELFVLSEKATDAIEVQLKQNMANAIALMREFSVDVADFYTFLFNSDKAKFLQFLDGLDDADEYLEHIVFKTSVRVYEK